MKTIAIIPARLASSRLPNKPLAQINQYSMVGHVLKRAELCKSLDQVFVATCDTQIYDHILEIGGNAVMTSDKHERASDRAAEAVQKIEKIQNTKFDIIAMIQGDEPMITPQMIEKAIEPLIANRDLQITNLMAKIENIDEFEDPAEVKVVFDTNKNALYFSREPIPSRKKGSDAVLMYKQVCVIPFKRDFLFKYNSLTQTPLEIFESIDMNRVLEYGYKIKMVEINDITYSVDTLQDLKRVIKLMKSDKLINNYNEA